MSITDEYDANTLTYRLHINQMTPPTLDQMDKVNLHIPVRVSLYDEAGKALPLKVQGIELDSDVLNVTQYEQTFEFSPIYKNRCRHY